MCRRQWVSLLSPRGSRAGRVTTRVRLGSAMRTASVRPDSNLFAKAPVALPRITAMQTVQRALDAVNRVLAVGSAIAIAAAGCVLTWEVIGRYFLGIASDWQDELTTFLLVGATFGSASWTQARRGHVGIEALAALLPPGADRVRRRLADLVACLFCGFFAWKSWVLLAEAWQEGQTTASSWGPPLWIPYSCMTFGMGLLALQILLQLLDGEPRGQPRGQPRGAPQGEAHRGEPTRGQSRGRTMSARRKVGQ